MVGFFEYNRHVFGLKQLANVCQLWFSTRRIEINKTRFSCSSRYNRQKRLYVRPGQGSIMLSSVGDKQLALIRSEHHLQSIELTMSAESSPLLGLK